MEDVSEATCVDHEPFYQSIDHSHKYHLSIIVVRMLFLVECYFSLNVIFGHHSSFSASQWWLKHRLYGQKNYLL